VCSFLSSTLTWFTPWRAERNSRDWRLAMVVGLLVGYGSRLSSGCTSGQGLCGLASFSRASLLAVLVFMAVAILTAQLVWHLGVQSCTCSRELSIVTFSG
jgi:uncharacterized membrane protein YedE/YeeE